MRLSRGLGAALCLAMSVGDAQLVAQNAPTQVQQVEVLGGKIELPLVRRGLDLMLLQLRHAFPDLFLRGVGQGAKLGTAWAPGNPHYDRARGMVVEQVAKAEAGGEPLLKLDMSPASAFFAGILTEADIQVLSRASQTELGRAQFRNVDAMAITGIEEALGAMGPQTPEVAEGMKALKAQGQKGFGADFVRISQLSAKDPKAKAAFERVLGKFGKAQGQQLGTLLMQKSMGRVMDAIYPVIGDLRKVVAEFQAAQPPQQAS